MNIMSIILQTGISVGGFGLSQFFGKLLEYLPQFGKGIWLTLELTFVSGILGFIFSIPLVLGVLYGNRFFKGLARGFISLVRGTPLLVQLFFIYFGFPAIGIRLSPLTAAMIGFILNSAAYQAEYLKGGFIAISKEQYEAALSLGLTKWQSIFSILLPQAFRFSLPSLSNEIIYLVKYTSVAYIIQVPELFAQAKYFASDTFYYLQIFLIIGFIYLFMVWLISNFMDYLEKRFYVPGFDVSHLK